MGMPDYYPFRSAQAQARYLAWYDQRAQTWPVAKETRMVETTDGTTCVHISGSPSAPPLVLLPGLGSNSLGWLAYIAAWSAHYRIYALDTIYDYGRSVAKRPIRRADVADWLEAVLMALGLERDINMMGISLGAWLSGQYAVRYPQRLRKLVWLAPVGTIQPLSWNGLARALLSAMLPQVFLRPFLCWMSPDLQRSPTGRAITDEMIEDIYVARQCFGSMPVIAPTVLTDAEFARLTMPVLCLIGEHERFQSAAKAADRLQRVAPWICAEIVPQAGHDLSALQVALVTRRVLGFLN